MIRQVDQARRCLVECRLGGGIMHRGERIAGQLDDYFVIIKRCGHHRRPPQTRWAWEIHRRSKPRGVKFYGDEYATPQDARLAGETALKEFLNNLSQR